MRPELSNGALMYNKARSNLSLFRKTNSATWWVIFLKRTALTTYYLTAMMHRSGECSDGLMMPRPGAKAYDP
jgi:hypothetical protein